MNSIKDKISIDLLILSFCLKTTNTDKNIFHMLSRNEKNSTIIYDCNVMEIDGVGIMYKKFFKRFFDIVLSLIFIILLSPIYLVISILVLIFMGWPIIFKQPRPGKNEKIFNMYKFRTMTNKKNQDGKLLPDDKRLSKFGSFLRKTSLDELPELFCIFAGKMSIIGPRPLLVEYLNYYTPEEHHRHDVRPGLTGLAQVNGRNLLNWDERFKKDIEYVNNITFIGDIKIIFKTIHSVIKHEGITDSKSLSMTPLYEERKAL